VELAVKELSEAEKQIASLSSKLDTLENLKDSGFGWYPQGVKALMKDPNAVGLKSPVAEALSIPDGYEAAAEAALGEKLGWLIVEDRAAGLAALNLAKKRGLGRCAFIPQNSLESQDLTANLLGPLKLVETLTEAEIADTSWSYLTPDGDYLGQSFLAGGTSHSEPNTSNKGKKEKNSAQQSPPQAPLPKDSPSIGLLSHLKELEAVRKDLQKATDNASKIKGKVDKEREKLKIADEALAVMENQKNSLSADLAEANSKIMVAISEEKGLIIRRDSLSGELNRTQEQIKASEEKIQNAQKDKEDLLSQVQILETNWKQAVAKAQKLSLDLEVLRESGQEASSLADSLSERLESAKREFSRVANWLKDLDSRRSSLSAQEASLLEKVQDLKAKAVEIVDQMEGLPEKLKQAELEVSQLRETITEKRTQITASEEEVRNTRHLRENSVNSLSEIEKKFIDTAYSLDKLHDDMMKDYRVILYDPEAIALDLTDNPFIKVTIPSEEDATDSEEQQQITASEESDDSGDSAEDEQSQSNEEDAESEEEEDDDDDDDNQASSQDIIQEDITDPDSSASTPHDQQDQLGLEENPVSEISPDASEENVPALAPPEKIQAPEWAAKELPEDAEATIANLKERLASMGEVNLSAIEEEAQLSERYNFHKTQYDDLQSAIDNLKDSITRINQTCRQRFGETFEKANEQFKNIFPVLFEGGEGWLSLTNEADPLESGVEIHVHPPGKKITVMRSLSGGEKTLTSLCLIFALYLIKPSPFCLLDEADAPLDEANIDRFNRLLRNLSESSQIIMVTHNKRTMHISDTLYGVTMETPGVSRLVGVNLAQAEVLSNA
jgi:chromosome segregation ATPase